MRNHRQRPSADRAVSGKQGTAAKWLAWGMSLLAGVGIVGSVPASAVVGDAVADGHHPYTVRVEIGDSARACSGALIEKMWIVTAASCFTEDPAQYASLAPGAPATPARAVLGRTDLTAGGGQVRDIVELVPRPDRDLVLARLSSVVNGVPTVALSAEPPVPGEQLTVAGYGRTADEWAPVRLHGGAFAVTGSNGPELHVDGQDGATICRGDAGGPAVRAGAGGDLLLGVSSRSAEGGCFGSETTSRAAVASRVDDITAWIGAQVSRWSLRSLSNDRYVSAAINVTGEDAGMLRARSETKYTWEQFTLHTRDAGASVSFRSAANGLYVAPEIARTGNQEGMLRARSETAFGWERFTLVPQTQAGVYALRSVESGKFVAVEGTFTGAYEGLLRARSERVAGSWERFALEHADNFEVAGVAPVGPTPLPVN